MTDIPTEETEQERDKRKQQEDINKRKARLKKNAGDIDGTAAALAKAIINSSGGTYDDLQETIEGFTSGYTEDTPDPNDTPYGMPKNQRPKVTILKENLPKKEATIPPKSTK